jgi:hypothetical protein
LHKRSWFQETTFFGGKSKKQEQNVQSHKAAVCITRSLRMNNFAKAVKNSSISVFYAKVPISFTFKQQNGGRGFMNDKRGEKHSKNKESFSPYMLNILIVNVFRVFFLFSWDCASLDMKVIYKTNEMRQIHYLYYDHCSTFFGHYSPIVRSVGNVCAAFGVAIL